MRSLPGIMLSMFVLGCIIPQTSLHGQVVFDTIHIQQCIGQPHYLFFAEMDQNGFDDILVQHRDVEKTSIFYIGDNGYIEDTLILSSVAHTTNAFGLHTLEIGTGASTDQFSEIGWESDIYFLKLTVDGNELGTSQLLSVPYALHPIPFYGAMTVGARA